MGAGRSHLYDLRLELHDDGGALIDTVNSYAGLRSISIDGRAMMINGERVFQRLVLDQGFWPDGLYTAPDEASLRRDIELAQAAGFNGARLHQKVFEERFYFHADQLGYLVWGEFGDWGARINGDPTDSQQPRRRSSPSGSRCWPAMSIIRASQTRSLSEAATAPSPPMRKVTLYQTAR